MDIREFLHSAEARLPRDRVPKVSFSTQLREMFSQYQQGIALLENGDPVCRVAKRNEKTIANTSNQVEKAVTEYLNGFPHKAYQCLASALNKIKPHLRRLKAPSVTMEGLYRARKIKDFSRMQRGDLFHMPFEVRYRVSSARYSISGLPCLYLGGSLWLCWEEIGKPPLETLSLACFQSGRKLSVLDFGFQPAVAVDLYRPQDQSEPSFFDDNWMKSYLVCWPLLAACSIRVEHPFEPFVPEYVIPQLLLQWIRNEAKEIDGLRYFSTKLGQSIKAPFVAINYVFPARHQADTGYCPELKKSFKMTEPVAWSLLRLVELPVSSPLATEREFLLTQDYPVRYDYTEFARLEHRLRQLPLDRL